MNRHKPLNDDQRRALQAQLLGVLRLYGLDVGIGLTRDGVAIRSQDARLDAQNVGDVRALPG